MGPGQILTFQVRVNLGILAIVLLLYSPQIFGTGTSPLDVVKYRTQNTYSQQYLIKIFCNTSCVTEYEFST